MKSLFLETTTIPASRSMSEIVEMLAQAGASAVQQTYNAGRPTGLSFTMQTTDGPLAFSIPARTNAVLSKLQQQLGPRSKKTGDDLQQQAERIAWRQLNAWVRAQLAIIEIGMVQTAEVFMPYTIGAAGRTMWEDFSSRKALPPGK